jgi:LysM repeat protein
MKHLLPILPLGSAFTFGFAWLAAAQPAQQLPGGYGYMQAPPAGYGTYQPQGSSSSRTQVPSYSAPRSTSTPKRTSTTYSPPQADLPTQVARLAANDSVQDSRIRKLEQNVASLKTGSSYLASTDTSSASLRPYTTYTVKPGDSLWAIASKHRVSPGEIIQLNRMKSDTVIIGQQLQIPSPHGSSGGGSTAQATYKPYYHDVRPGDSSTSIAKKYSISRNALMDANPRVDFGSGLIPGSRVIIPGKGTRVETAPRSSSYAAGSSGTYTVKPGDSLKAIAIRHGTSTANLASLNGIKDANKLVVGQRIILPGGKAPSTSRSITSSKPKSTPKASAKASDDTTPLPGMGLPDGMPPPPIVALPSSQLAASTKPSTPPADSHRGVLAYRVDATDSIESIASQFSTTPARIREMNHLQPTTKLNSGDEIMVPALGAVSVGN